MYNRAFTSFRGAFFLEQLKKLFSSETGIFDDAMEKTALDGFVVDRNDDEEVGFFGVLHVVVAASDMVYKNTCPLKSTDDLALRDGRRLLPTQERLSSPLPLQP